MKRNQLLFSVPAKGVSAQGQGSHFQMIADQRHAAKDVYGVDSQGLPELRRNGDLSLGARGLTTLCLVSA